jgi:hypothetical protein
MSEFSPNVRNGQPLRVGRYVQLPRLRLCSYKNFLKKNVLVAAREPRVC